MPRKLREIIQGVTYHCFTRCHNKKDLFHSSHVRRYLVESVKKCQEKYVFELIAVEPVGNHIHLVILTKEDGETISRIMQYIKSRIAEKYNRSTGSTGAFWNERYYSEIIEQMKDPEDYFFRTLWEIGYKPVLKGLTVNPRENFIGFINCYIDEKYIPDVDIALHRYFISLGNSFKERACKFLFYEREYIRSCL